MPKAFFIDTSKCTACRGCQVACKEWHNNPATETKQVGTHQNPQDLNYHTYKLVRFSEKEVDNKLHWLFFADQCRHCVVPPCKEVADMDVEGAIIIDEETGCVFFTEKTAELSDPEGPRFACPYDIPRQAPDSNRLAKCDMCLDRVQNGLKPACVQVCPTGTMNFGEYDEMKELAEKRLVEAKKTRPNAVLNDLDFHRCFVLFETDPGLYHDYAVASADVPGPLGRRTMLANVSRPFKVLFR